VSALSRQMNKLPVLLQQSLTWDRGTEMASHAKFSIATDIDVYFCDPQSPWQRGTNENTNGLLRQYFPKRSSLSGFLQQDLNKVGHRLNTRPKKTLDFQTPADMLNQLLQWPVESKSVNKGGITAAPNRPLIANAWFSSLQQLKLVFVYTMTKTELSLLRVAGSDVLKDLFWRWTRKTWPKRPGRRYNEKPLQKVEHYIEFGEFSDSWANRTINRKHGLFSLLVFSSLTKDQTNIYRILYNGSTIIQRNSMTNSN